jgi:pimeloyl-ACP methyl ester carboxylesterase
MSGVLTALFAPFVLFPLLTPLPPPQEVAEGQSVRLNGFEMYYETLGEGEPLLLVHGWSGNTSYFEPFLEPLAEHYRLIIPDLRGHGRSTNPGGEFTMAQAAMDLSALLDHLGVGRVRALGASAGGVILLHMGTLQPSRIDQMILIGTGSRFLPHCRESMAMADAAQYAEPWWELMRARHVRGDAQILEIVGYLRSFAENETDVAFSPSALSRIEAETLIVHGDRDWCFPPSMAVELFDAIPNASLWVIPWGEHVPVMDQHAPEFLRTALAFFAGGGADAGSGADGGEGIRTEGSR